MNLFDMREVVSLATDLGKTSRAVESEAERVLERGALNVKNKMVEDAQVHGGHAKRFASSISYERRSRVGQIGFEIGPDKDRPQGALGNLLYFGSKNNAPTLDVEAGLIDEEPRLVSEMAKMLGRVMGGA